VANRQCNLTKRVNTAQGLRFCAVVLSANGRVKPDVVLIGNRRGTQREPTTSIGAKGYLGI